jgi:hypothetical protein
MDRLPLLPELALAPPSIVADFALLDVSGLHLSIVLFSEFFCAFQSLFFYLLHHNVLL